MIRIKFILFFSINTFIYSQCPAVPVCTQTAVSGTNYTVLPGDVLCVNSNYLSGIININGGTLTIESGGTISGGSAFVNVNTGTLNVSSGGTLTKNVLPTVSATINMCGTLSGTRQFNDKTTLNYYSASNYALDMRNGTIINNYSTTASVAVIWIIQI